MSALVKLFPTDNLFKLKMLGYSLLLGLVMLILYSILMLMMTSSIEVIEILAIILLFPTVCLYTSFCLYVCINKLLTEYYPNFKISPIEAVKSGMAALVITIIMVFMLVVISVLSDLVVILFNSVFINILVYIAMVVLYFQFVGLVIGIIYSIVKNVEYQQSGFRALFKTYFKNILVIRKECVNIGFLLCSMVVLVSIILMFDMLVVAFISLIVNPPLYFIMSDVLILLFYVIMGWVILTGWLYIIKKYHDIAVKIEV